MSSWVFLLTPTSIPHIPLDARCSSSETPFGKSKFKFNFFFTTVNLLCSRNEENKFKWNVAFCLTLKAKVPAFKVYYKVCSFITYHGIFMAPGYGLGKESIWCK